MYTTQKKTLEKYGRKKGFPRCEEFWKLAQHGRRTRIEKTMVDAGQALTAESTAASPSAHAPMKKTVGGVPTSRHRRSTAVRQDGHRRDGVGIIRQRSSELLDCWRSLVERQGQRGAGRGSHETPRNKVGRARALRSG